MELQYAKRFDGITGSVIRDIFKLLTNPDIISFAGGNPANSALESDVISEFAQQVLRQNGTQILQYGQTATPRCASPRRSSTSASASPPAPSRCCPSRALRRPST